MAAKKAFLIPFNTKSTTYYLEALDQDENPFRTTSPPHSARILFVRFDSAHRTISGYNHTVSCLVFRTLPIIMMIALSWFENRTFVVNFFANLKRDDSPV